LREVLGAGSSSFGESAELASPLPPSLEGSAGTSVQIIKTKIVYHLVEEHHRSWRRRGHFPSLRPGWILEEPGRSLTGLTPTTEVEMLVATHGWWPWLLTLAVILIVVAAIAYFARRRRAA
jgi:hypothetical protein